MFDANKKILYDLVIIVVIAVSIFDLEGHIIIRQMFPPLISLKFLLLALP